MVNTQRDGSPVSVGRRVLAAWQQSSPLTSRPPGGPRRSIILIFLLLAMVCFGRSAIAQDPTWRQVSQLDLGVIPLGMAYDSARGVMVLLGNRFNGWDTQTWEFDGTGWTLRATSPMEVPPYSRIRMIAYDSRRGVTVALESNPSSYPTPTWDTTTTWEWDGIAWRRIVTAGGPGAIGATGGPGPRQYPGIVYHEQAARIVLFGGSGPYSALSDTWTWDGATWTQIHGPGPSARYAHQMTYDSRRGVAVLIGGTGGYPVTRPRDVWEFDGTQWQLRVADSPLLDTTSSIAFDPSRGVTFMPTWTQIVYGQPVSTLIEWDGVSLRQRDVSQDMSTFPYTLISQRYPICFDTARRVAIGISTLPMSGYPGGIYPSETWELGVPCGPTGAPITQPEPVATCPTAAATFLIQPSGPVQGFRWQRETTPMSGEFVNLTNGSTAFWDGVGGDAVVFGANTSALTIVPDLIGGRTLSQAVAVRYRCIVNTACGPMVGVPVQLSVAAPCSLADVVGSAGGGLICGDSTVDGADFIAFINSFAVGDADIDPTADIAGGGDTGLEPDGTIDGTDFIFFINAFAIGC